MRCQGYVRPLCTPRLNAKPDLLFNLLLSGTKLPFDDMTPDEIQCPPPDRLLAISDLRFVRLVRRSEVLDCHFSVGHEGLLSGEKWKIALSIRLDPRIHKGPVKVPAVNIHCNSRHPLQPNPFAPSGAVVLPRPHVNSYRLALRLKYGTCSNSAAFRFVASPRRS